MLSIWTKPHRFQLMILPVVLFLCTIPAMGQEGKGGSFHVGYRTFDFTCTYPDGRTRTMTTAVWYPTHEAPAAYTYPGSVQTKGALDTPFLKSMLAVNAPPATKEGPFPFVLFAHGAFGCAVNSAFFTEYLASRGFVVAAPDFEDTVPPDFTRQLAFARLGDGNVALAPVMLAVTGTFVNTFNADREKCLWYAGKFRFQPARFVIDQMLEMNKKESFVLRGLIDENALGISGHSLGGLTCLGLIGPHPDPKMQDERIKAVLIFSAPVYPFENSIGKISIPLLTMFGDNDPNGLGPEYPRKLLYEKAHPPKFCMIFRDATHFTFCNPRCEDISRARESDPHVRVIQDYGTSFFKRYLKGDHKAEERLSTPDDMLALYKYEMQLGKERVWGETPAPKDASPGGLREELRKRLQARRESGRRQEKPTKAEDQPGGYQPSGKFKVKVIKDIAYYDGPDADTQKHKLDLYLPEGQKGFPVLMFIHGGGWKMGDKDQAFGMYGTLGSAFAQEGIGTAIISYRLSPQVIHPEHIRDCARAFAWVHKHIEEYGGRKDRIFVTGQSAGGHLCSLLATNEKYLKEHGLSSDNIVGVIPISGVYRIFNNAFNAFGTDPADWRDASPINHVHPKLPPCLIIVGDKDFPGASLMASSFAHALKSNGNAAEVIEIPDRTHLTVIARVGTPGDQTTAEMLRFIRERLSELNKP